LEELGGENLTAPISFSEPIPRKGTETMLSSIQKRFLQLATGFSEPIPRKGTETFIQYEVVDLELSTGFSEPIPRKGTETYLFEFTYRQ